MDDGEVEDGGEAVSLHPTEEPPDEPYGDKLEGISPDVVPVYQGVL